MTLPVLLLCLSVGCQPHREEVAEKPAVDVEADVEAIRALFAHNASVINSGDLDGWIAQFTEDAIFMPPNSVILRGRDAGREFARPWYEQLDIEFEISVDEIEVHGDWAFARWSGKEIWILRRQADGTWKCSHIIYNTDTA
jgi:uncharacterized protein (TIGR02246 family)